MKKSWEAGKPGGEEGGKDGGQKSVVSKNQRTDDGRQIKKQGARGKGLSKGGGLKAWRWEGERKVLRTEGIGLG